MKQSIITESTNFQRMHHKKTYGTLHSNTAILAAMLVSGCGGGGSTTAAPSVSQVGSSTTGGGAVVPNALSIIRSGSGYETTLASGFTQQGSASRIYVEDDKTDNFYQTSINAQGVGMLEFEFEDENDTVSFDAGSKITGFSQLKVLHGSVDFTNVDLDGVTYVAVASSARFSFAQATNIEAIVSNSPDGQITFDVSSVAEAEQLQSMISSGVLKAYGEGAVVKLEPAEGSSVSTSALSEIQGDMNTQVADVAENVVEELSTELATVTTSGGAVIAVAPPAGGASSGGGGSATTSSEPVAVVENAFLSGEADIFNVTVTEASESRYSVEVFLDNVFPNLVTGIPAVDLTFSVSGGAVVDRGTVDITSASGGAAQELIEYVSGDNAQTGGRIIAVYNAANKFSDFSEKFFSFELQAPVDDEAPVTLGFVDINVGGSLILDANYALDL